MAIRLPRGTQLLALWLALILVVSGALAAQAFRAQRGRREAAERVLANYAHLAATGLAERLEIRFGAYTLATLGGLSINLDPSNPGPTADPHTLDVGPRAHLALQAVSAVRRVSLADSTAATAAPDDTTFARALAPVLRGHRADDPEWGAILRGDRCFAYRVFHDAPGRASHAWVFVFDPDSLGTSLRDIAGVAPLLPTFLLGKDPAPAWLHWRIETPDGRPLASSPGAADFRGPFAASDTTSRPLDRCITRVQLDAPAAWVLIPGGVPGSNLPQTLALLALGVALLAAAYAQTRREAATARMREDFIASISHELRTPLAQIRLFTETLKLDRVRDDLERERALEIVDRESSRLAHLVDNVLLASRAGRGVLSAHLEPADVGALVQDVGGAFAPLAAARDAHLALDVHSGLRARVDADLLRQALLNLLDNAVKFGPAGQTVALSAAAEDGQVRLRVDDAGPGIPERNRGQVWGRFYRLERDRGAHVTGSGLGLAVVREVVALHDGTVAIHDAPGGGARVEIRLPRTSGAAP